MPLRPASIAAVCTTKDGFVALAAMGHGREIRRIGLNKKPICRHSLERVAQLAGIFERRDTGDRNRKADVECRIAQSRRARKAMQEAGERRARHFLVQDRDRIVIGIARMHDER